MFTILIAAAAVPTVIAIGAASLCAWAVLRALIRVARFLVKHIARPIYVVVRPALIVITRALLRCALVGSAVIATVLIALVVFASI